MADFSVECKGQTWAEDFGPQVKKLYGYFFRCFRDWPDTEELVQEAICMFMRDFAKKWKHGETVKLAPVLSARAVKNGINFIPRPRGGWHRRDAERPGPGPCPSKPCIVRLRLNIMLAGIDYRIYLETLCDTDRQVVEMAVQGTIVNHIRKETGLGYHRIRRILREAIDALS